MEIFAHHNVLHATQMNIQQVIGIAFVATTIALFLAWRHEK